MSYGKLLPFVLLLAACESPAVSPGDGGELPDAGESDGAQPGADLAGTPDLAPAVTTIRIHYPVGSAALTLRGDTAPLSWGKGVTLTAGTDGAFTFTLPLATTAVQYKPLLDDSRWAHGPNYVVEPGQTVDVYPHFVASKGTVKKLFAAFPSKVFTFNQPVWVYLPPSYDENSAARYPVLYMQDGQNLFDPALAFQGHEWMVDEALDAAAESDLPKTPIREIIVVAPEAGPNRNTNYTPTYDMSEGWGGNGDNYLRMLVEELKPEVDSQLRTLPGRDTTGIMGSSLGGLISAYAGTTHAATFGLVGPMSPSTWWDNTMIIDRVSKMAPSPARPLRVYVDSGDSGQSKDDVVNTTALAATYRQLGYTDGVDLLHVVEKGGQHSEIYWAGRVPGAMQFLFGRR